MQKAIVFFFLGISLSFCMPEQDPELIAEADSLILLTLELQQVIGSTDIMRLSEFQDQINSDLQLLDSAGFSQADVPVLKGKLPEPVSLYLELNQGLAHCLRACSQFHEEAFMLETIIKDIKDKSGLKGTDHQELKTMLQKEWAVYRDLAFRIDSSIQNVNNHSKEFYNLRPAIDSILAATAEQP